MGQTASVDYDTDLNSVLIDLDFAFSPDDLAVDLAFDLDLGALAEISTDTKLQLLPELEIDLDLGIDLNPLSEVTESTKVRKLNGGVGIKPELGKDDLKISLRDGTVAMVNLDSADTIGGRVGFDRRCLAESSGAVDRGCRQRIADPRNH